MERPSHVDVLIIGAGISGIGAACRLTEDLPQKSYAILEARDAIGGTWDLFRYPGVRSDSDLHTLGYQFRPWMGENAIVDGPEVLGYIRDTAAEYGVDRNIRYGCHVTSASWDSNEAIWTVEATVGGKETTMTCGWLFSASGYFRYDHGYQPHFEGQERFSGQIIHPQAWPEDLDYAGKKVVVIGSGATAVTLVPALAEQASHVTMLQRSPTYIISVPRKDAVANLLNRLLPEELASSITRRKNIWRQRFVFNLAQSRPELVKRFLRWSLKQQLPDDYEIDRHFAPDYDPWDQRLCAVPSGDLFKSLSKGDCSVVTDKIASFTEDGIELVSGEMLQADIIVTATGLELLAFGGIELTVDGSQVELPEMLTYKGSMLSEVPNFAFAMGNYNVSLTLKVGIVIDYICRVIGYMDRCGFDKCTAVNPDPSQATSPMLDFGAGYVNRSLHLFPRQGSIEHWELSQDLARDQRELASEITGDGALQFERVESAARRVPVAS
ncbi:MAG: NAD(P)/FAD-dependent oxidoreductase [Actinomycetes bacterium]